MGVEKQVIDPAPVPNPLRAKPSPFTAPDSGKVVIYPSSSGVSYKISRKKSDETFKILHTILFEERLLRSKQTY